MSAETLHTQRQLHLAMIHGIGSGVGVIIFGLLLARSMRMADFGEYSAAIGMLEIAGVFSLLGLSQLGIGIARRAHASMEFNLLRGFQRRAPVLILIASTIAFAVLVSFHLLVHEHTTVRVSSFVVVIALLPFTALRSLYGGLATGHGAAMGALSLDGWGTSLLQIGLLGVAVLVFGPQLTVIQAAIIASGSLFFCVLSLYWLCKHQHPREYRTGERAFATRDWLSKGSWIALTVIGLLLLDKGGLVVSGWIHADAIATARLSAAMHLTAPYWIAGAATRRIFGPTMAAEIKRNPSTATGILFRKWNQLTLPFATVYIALIVFFGDDILRAYGSGFEAAHSTAIIIGIAYIIGVSSALLFVRLIQRSGRFKVPMVATSLWSALGLVLMVILGNYWSDLGIAVAMLICITGAGLTCAAIAFRR